jgi:hypothetical protein
MIKFSQHQIKSENSVDISANYIGMSDTPILIFDFDFDISDYLINKASKYKMDWVDATNFYPGIWAKVPKGFCTELHEFIQPYIDKYFFKCNTKVSNIHSCYAMAVKDKDKFITPQRIPHFDSFSHTQIATLLYLCDEEFGSTAFYRHRKTGIEKVTEYNKNDYMKTIKKEIDDLDNISMDPSGLLFEKIFECKAKKGRLLIYPSSIFHNGLINEVNNTCVDPEKGRLTITSFINYRFKE